MNVLIMVLLTILTLANLGMFIAVAGFKKHENVKANKASRVGFTTMEIIFACNVIAIVGGMVVCSA